VGPNQEFLVPAAFVGLYHGDWDDASFRMVRLRGLTPENSYLVRFQESSRTLTMTGTPLMNDGVRVDLPGMWTAEIVYVEPLKQ
jgi:hypothetical protein